MKLRNDSSSNKSKNFGAAVDNQPIVVGQPAVGGTQAPHVANNNDVNQPTEPAGNVDVIPMIGDLLRDIASLSIANGEIAPIVNNGNNLNGEDNAQNGPNGNMNVDG